jgi:hypothetical protein
VRPAPNRVLELRGVPNRSTWGSQISFVDTVTVTALLPGAR